MDHSRGHAGEITHRLDQICQVAFFFFVPYQSTPTNTLELALFSRFETRPLIISQHSGPQKVVEFSMSFLVATTPEGMSGSFFTLYIQHSLSSHRDGTCLPVVLGEPV